MRPMQIDQIPNVQNLHDFVVSSIVAAWGLLVALVEPSRLLIVLTIILTLVKLVHSVILLRRDWRANRAGAKR